MPTVSSIINTINAIVRIYALRGIPVTKEWVIESYKDLSENLIILSPNGGVGTRFNPFSRVLYDEQGNIDVDNTITKTNCDFVDNISFIKSILLNFGYIGANTKEAILLVTRKYQYDKTVEQVCDNPDIDMDPDQILLEKTDTYPEALGKLIDAAYSRHENPAKKYIIVCCGDFVVANYAEIMANLIIAKQSADKGELVVMGKEIETDKISEFGMMRCSESEKDEYGNYHIGKRPMIEKPQGEKAEEIKKAIEKTQYLKKIARSNSSNIEEIETANRELKKCDSYLANTGIYFGRLDNIYNAFHERVKYFEECEKNKIKPEFPAMNTTDGFCTIADNCIAVFDTEWFDVGIADSLKKATISLNNLIRNNPEKVFLHPAIIDGIKNRVSAHGNVTALKGESVRIQRKACENSLISVESNGPSVTLLALGLRNRELKVLALNNNKIEIVYNNAGDSREVNVLGKLRRKYDFNRLVIDTINEDFNRAAIESNTDIEKLVRVFGINNSLSEIVIFVNRDSNGHYLITVAAKSYLVDLLFKNETADSFAKLLSEAHADTDALAELTEKAVTLVTAQRKVEETELIPED